MSIELPEFIEPLRLAQHERSLQGLMPIVQMARLQDSLCDNQGDISIVLHFQYDDQNRPVILGKIQGQLALLCQRCLQPMQYPLQREVVLFILKTGQSDEGLPDSADFLTLEQSSLSLWELVEDEIILSLPIVALHEQCPQNEYTLPDETAQTVPDRPNPFQLLAKLKKP
jgi:uncharacterized protein